MYNFLNFIFSLVTMLSTITLISCACLEVVTDSKHHKAIRCVHLYSQRILFYCLFIGGFIHIIF